MGERSGRVLGGNDSFIYDKGKDDILFTLLICITLSLKLKRGHL